MVGGVGLACSPVGCANSVVRTNTVPCDLIFFDASAIGLTGDFKRVDDTPRCPLAAAPTLVAGAAPSAYSAAPMTAEAPPDAINLASQALGVATLSEVEAAAAPGSTGGSSPTLYVRSSSQSLAIGVGVASTLSSAEPAPVCSNDDGGEGVWGAQVRPAAAAPQLDTGGPHPTPLPPASGSQD